MGVVFDGRVERCCVIHCVKKNRCHRKNSTFNLSDCCVTFLVSVAMVPSKGSMCMIGDKNKRTKKNMVASVLYVCTNVAIRRILGRHPQTCSHPCFFGDKIIECCVR